MQTAAATTNTTTTSAATTTTTTATASNSNNTLHLLIFQFLFLIPPNAISVQYVNLTFSMSLTAKII
jgi:hypothetical protein